MAYPRRLLNDGEEIRVEVMPHWSMLFWPAVASGVALVLLVIAASVGGGAWTVAGAVVLALCLGWFGVVWLVRSTTEVVVTTDRLISRSGVFAKSGIEIPLGRVNNIMFRQTIVERLLGSGDLIVESAGESGQQHYSDIPRPAEVQNQIYRAMEDAQARDAERAWGGRTSRGDRSGRTDGGHARHDRGGQASAWLPYSVADELAKLDELRQRGVLTQEEFEGEKRRLLRREAPRPPESRSR